MAVEVEEFICASGDYDIPMLFDFLFKIILLEHHNLMPATAQAIRKRHNGFVRSAAVGESVFVDADFHSYLSNALNRILAHPAPSDSRDLPSVIHSLYFHFSRIDFLRLSSGIGTPEMRSPSIHIHSGAVN